MSNDARKVRSLATLLATTIVLASVLSAGCLEEEEPTVPDDRKDTHLLVDGDVPSDLNLSFEEVMDLGTEDFTATFVNSVGTTYTSNYTGVRVNSIKGLAKPTAAVDEIVVTASDGYQAMLFMSDVTDTTYIALKVEGKWQDLEEDGAFRIVDTNLPSSYWVRDVVALTFTTSTPISVHGMANVTDVLTVGWIKTNADRDVTWQEGTKARTYPGVAMGAALLALDVDQAYANMLRLVDGDGEDTIVLVWEALGAGLTVDSRGEYVYVEAPDGLVVKEVVSIEVSAGIRVFGDVGHEARFTMDTLHDLPQGEVTTGGSTYVGAYLSAAVAEAVPNAAADAVKVFAGDGYNAVFPLTDIQSPVLAHQVDGEPLELGTGPYRVIDASRPGPYSVSWVTEVMVYTSTPVEASGKVNLTDAIDIGFVGANKDIQVTYNDGKKDRTYDAVSWDVVLEALDYDASDATAVVLEDSTGASVQWFIAELVDKDDAGICVDPKGNYVAVYEELGATVAYLVSIEVV